MKQFNSLEDVMQFAISLEQMSYDFYVELSGRADSASMKEVLLLFAAEELTHKQRLENILGLTQSQPLSEQDHREIAGYIAAVPTPSHLTYEQAIKTAINKEHAAYMLYQILARVAQNSQLRGILELLAQEELHHKRRFEKEQHDIRLKKN